jgi:hypothetical protein
MLFPSRTASTSAFARRCLSYTQLLNLHMSFSRPLFSAAATARLPLPHSEVFFNLLVIFQQSFLFPAIVSLSQQLSSFNLFVRKCFDVTSLKHSKL